MLSTLVALSLAAAQPKLAVMPIPSGEVVREETASAITEAVAAETRRRSGGQVITQREIASVLSLERQKAMLGCQTDSCMAELAGALGVDSLVAGNLSKVGDSWMFHLKLIGAKRIQVLAQADRRIRGGTLDDVLDALPVMVGELFAGAPARSVASPVPAAPAPAAPPAASAPARPLPPPWVEEPAAVGDEERAKLMLFDDGKGNLVASGPHEARLVLAGDAKKLFKLWLQSGGAEGSEKFEWSFWEPRAVDGWQRSFEVKIPEGTAKLQCGDSAVAFKRVSDARARKILARAALLEARWRRVGQVLGRSDEGEYWYVDAARTAGGDEAKKRDFRLYVGRKGALVRLELLDAIEDPAGMLFVTAGGRLELKRAQDGDTKLAWITAAGRRELTFLPIYGQGPLIYGELGVYAGERLGTPCDGRL